jgi:hypothetical protein
LEREDLDDADDLDEVLGRIVASRPADWRRLDDPGSPYRHLLVLQADPDISIGISDDLDPQTPQVRNREQFAREWTAKWGWGPPQWRYAEVRHQGQVVTRHLVVWLDAGRAVLPGGDLLTADCTPGSAFGLSVDECDYRLARLLHGVELGDSEATWRAFDHYLGSTGIRRPRDHL